MTEAEATDYVKNSMFADMTFYHGTSAAGADSITTSGIDIKKNEVALYGRGFYLAEKRYSAEGYAKKNAKPTILSVKLDMRNPLVVNNFLEVQKVAGTGDATKQRTKLKKLGYDGVFVQNMRFYVAFDPQQVAVYEKERV